MRGSIFPGVIASFVLLNLAARCSPAYEGEECPRHNLKPAGPCELSSLVRFSCEQGRLVPRFTPPAEWDKGEAMRVRIKGSDAQWIWRITPPKTPGAAPADRIVEIWYRDAGDEKQDGFAKAAVYCRGDYVAISAVMRIKEHAVTVTLRSRNDAKAVEFEAYAEEDGQFLEQLVSAQGPSLESLRAEHQPEVDLILGPLLRTLTHSNPLGPGPADVYRLFPGIEADTQVVNQVRQLLPALGSADPRRRDRAGQELAGLGRAGVLAAMRWDTSTLSPEQRSRLLHFIESHRRRQIINLALARRDTTLLLECLEDEDPAVRAAAQNVLEKTLARPVAFDPSQNYLDRHAAVERIRNRLQDTAPNVIHASDR